GRTAGYYASFVTLHPHVHESPMARMRRDPSSRTSGLRRPRSLVSKAVEDRAPWQCGRNSMLRSELRRRQFCESGKSGAPRGRPATCAPASTSNTNPAALHTASSKWPRNLREREGTIRADYHAYRGATMGTDRADALPARSRIALREHT